ncbi:synapse differentiation-inducing protein 1, partial [Biomphalaria pfeifferi]
AILLIVTNRYIVKKTTKSIGRSQEARVMANLEDLHCESNESCSDDLILVRADRLAENYDMLGLNKIKRERHVSDYLGLSIFTTLCCCLPLGIWAIIESLWARKLASEGRYADALKSSRCALDLNIASLILGAILITVLIIYSVVLKQERNDP